MSWSGTKHRAQDLHKKRGVDMDYTESFVLFLTSLINITNDIKERRIQAIKEKLKSLSARERAEIKMALSEIFEEDA